MDPLTHAASGAAAMLAMPRRPSTRWAVPLAALAAAFPDVDMLFANSPLNLLLLHRGITHSLFFAPLLGLLLALAARPLQSHGTPGRWKLRTVWLFMTCMVLLHIWLDCITTYGTMIFLPFSSLRVRLNAVFIIDFLLTLPLLWAIWRWRARRTLLLLVLAWLFVYPAFSIAINAHHEARATARLAAQGRDVSRVVILPDALAPFYWRALYAENTSAGLRVHTQGLDMLGRPHSPEATDTGLSPHCEKSLAGQSVTAGAFLEFTLLPVVSPLEEGLEPPPDTGAPLAADNSPVLRYTKISDQRFGSNLDFVRKIMAARAGSEVPFALLAETAFAKNHAGTDGQCGRLVREALHFPNHAAVPRWQPPQLPSKPALWRWFVGLR